MLFYTYRIRERVRKLSTSDPPPSQNGHAARKLNCNSRLAAIAMAYTGAFEYIRAYSALNVGRFCGWIV